MFFFFNDTATTEIYTLSLHDALPIWVPGEACGEHADGMTRNALVMFADGTHLKLVAFVDPDDERDNVWGWRSFLEWRRARRDRKSTRLNSSHANISYAVLCLKKKKHS